MVITEHELKDRCTPEFIKWMCEMAEGFECSYESSDKRSFIIKRIPNFHEFYEWLWTWHSFPLLIHRAVEGCNKLTIGVFRIYESAVSVNRVDVITLYFNYEHYQSQSLTQAECALLHCLLDIFKEI